jgi:hypothetical protein
MPFVKKIESIFSEFQMISDECGTTRTSFFYFIFPLQHSYRALLKLALFVMSIVASTSHIATRSVLWSSLVLDDDNYQIGVHRSFNQVFKIYY